MLPAVEIQVGTPISIQYFKPVTPLKKTTEDVHELSVTMNKIALTAEVFKLLILTFVTGRERTRGERDCVCVCVSVCCVEQILGLT